MSEKVLNYAAVRRGPPPRWLTGLVLGLMCYPLVTALAIYGGWVLLWSQVGHAPRSCLDNPTGALGQLLFDVSAVLFLGGVPVFFGGVVVTAVHAMFQLTAERRRLLWAGFALAWLVTAVLLYLDPGGGMNWWLD